MMCAHKDCKKKAVVRYSPDLDIRGVGACKEHKVHVHYALLMKLDKTSNKMSNKKPKRNK